MAEPNVWGLTASQLKRLGEMLAAFESGALWPPEKPLPQLREHQLAKVRFHNDSGEAIPPYAYMRILGASVNTDGIWRLSVGKQNDTFYSVGLVNSFQLCPVSSDSWGTFLWHSGHVLCDSTYVPTVGQEWGPTSGSWSLVRHRPGFLIDGGPTGSGATYRAVAKQRIVCDLFGKPNGDLTKGTAGPVTPWMRNSATGTYEDSGYDDLTAYPIGSDVADALFCSLRFDCGQWAAACLEP